MSSSEMEYVHQAFARNDIAPLGPQVDAFEREFSEYTGIKNCVALTSGTAAMHLALHHLGVEPGDEVFASSLTFIGSVTPATFLGATPVFIDCDRESRNMDPALLAEELARCADQGKLPKAFIPTDLYGQRADYDRVKRKREIFDYYADALAGTPGIELMPEAAYGKSNRWLTVILITPEIFGADRDAVRLALWGVPHGSADGR